MKQPSEIFNQEVIDSLYPFQLECLTKAYNDYEKINEESKQFNLKTCPKCGSLNPRFVKSGFSSTGKQMMRCHDCNKRIVVDHGQLTFHSQQSEAKWDRLIQETVKGNSIKQTAAAIDVSERTALRMRHKFLNALEQSESPICS